MLGSGILALSLDAGPWAYRIESARCPSQCARDAQEPLCAIAGRRLSAALTQQRGSETPRAS